MQFQKRKCVQYAVVNSEHSSNSENVASKSRYRMSDVYVDNCRPNIVINWDVRVQTMFSHS